MLVAAQETITQLLYAQGKIDPREVEISFDAPTKEWIGQRMRPAIDLFLFDVRENTDLRQTSFQSTRVNGRAERRLPPRRVDARFMVSTHATDAADAHRLLWRALVTLMQFPELPPDLLADDLRHLDIPLTTRVAQADDAARMTDLWGGMGVEAHPAFCYVVTVPVDLEQAISAPLVLTRTMRFGRGLDGIAEEAHTHIGGVVRTQSGTPLTGVRVAVTDSAAEAAVTNADGEFRLFNVPSGEVPLRVVLPDGSEQTATVTVPSTSYDIVWNTKP